MNKKRKKYIKPDIIATLLPVNFLYSGRTGYDMNDLLINQVYAQSNSIYLPYISNNSDRRLKKNVSKIPNALEKIQKLNGVYFEWKNMNKESNKEIGLIAQDVQTVIPEVVRKNSETGFFTVKYSQLTALLIEGMKEQQEEITDLKERIKKLT